MATGATTSVSRGVVYCVGRLKSCGKYNAIALAIQPICVVYRCMCVVCTCIQKRRTTPSIIGIQMS